MGRHSTSQPSNSLATVILFPSSTDVAGLSISFKKIYATYEPVFPRFTVRKHQQDMSLVTSVSSKLGIVPGMCFRASPRCCGWKWVYFRLLPLACYCYSIKCLYASTGKHNFCHVQLVLLIVHFTHMLLLNPQSINCLMFWIKLAIARGFGLSPLLAPFSQAAQRLGWIQFI